MRIVIFCHVEPGTSRDNEIHFHPRYLEGISIALPRIVEFADESGLAMTFAMTPTALKENDTDLGGHEVGVHLHPQDTQLRDTLGGEVTLSSDCLMHYSARDQATLIEATKRFFEQEEGRSPRTFVAGNWSENNTTLKLLAGAGFSFDGSPLPNHSSGCADWSRIPRLTQPYAPSGEDYQARGAMDYLYIPVLQGLWGHYVTPEIIHLLGASYFKAALKEAVVGGAEVAHIFFHSPMATDPRFLMEFKAVVEYAHDQLGVQSVLPSACRASGVASARPYPPAYLARLNWRLAKGFLGRGELGRRIMGLGASDAANVASPAKDEESSD
ncbi:MAG: hypothetical protein ACE5JI_10845 [Acidobacteriota bacterium]